MPYELGQITKDPDAKLPYKVDWSEWLEPTDTINTAEVLVSPNDGTLVVSDVSLDLSAKVVIFWLAAGVAGRTYVVTCRISPTQYVSKTGKDDRSFELIVRNR